MNATTLTDVREVEHAEQIGEQLLDAFERTLADLRLRYRSRSFDQVLTVATLQRRHEARARQMNMAICRLAACMARAGVR